MSWLREYILGEQFRLRSRLSMDECIARIRAMESIPLTTAWDMTDAPTIVARRLRNFAIAHAWIPAQKHGPRLIARLVEQGPSTEIVGTVGSDFLFLGVALAMETILLLTIIETGSPALLPILLVPILFFIVKRSDPNGGALIDYVQSLLEAESPADRKGDPICR